jgi:hypothetical protein
MPVADATEMERFLSLSEELGDVILGSGRRGHEGNWVTDWMSLFSLILVVPGKYLSLVINRG